MLSVLIWDSHMAPPGLFTSNIAALREKSSDI